MTLSEIAEILKKLRSGGVFQINFTGGEIFLRNDILTIIEMARKMHFKVNLLSNISLMNEHIINTLDNLFVSGISCTIFSMDEKSHDNFTGIPGSLERILYNAQLIKKSNIPLTIKIMVTNQNYLEIDKVIDYCRENEFVFSIDYEIYSQKNNDIAPLKYRLDNAKMNKFFESSSKYLATKAKEHCSDEYLCEDTRYSLFINSQGDVFACNKLSLSLGNILKVEKINDIWEKSIILRNMQELKRGDLKECNNCDFSRYCHICPGMSYQETNRLLGHTSFMCSAAKAKALNNTTEGIL